MGERQRLTGLGMVLALMATGCAAPREQVVRLRLGETTVRVAVTQRGGPHPTLINVHDDENTSVTAGLAALRESSGRLIELQHGGHRLVTFTIAGITNRVDPNRIFSPAGIRATLERRGHWSAPAARAVAQFAGELWQRFDLGRAPVIIALHNTDGRGLTIHSYRGDDPLSSASARVQVSQSRGPGDFFYVTDRRFFDYLAARDFNVTLQDDANVPDDGSLSVFCARQEIPYVNIEAANQHLAAQTEMVRVVLHMVRELGLVPKAR